MGALALTVAAIYYPVEADDGVAAVSKKKTGAAPNTRAMPAALEAAASMPEVDMDPFAPRGWQAPPPPPPQQAVVATQPSAPPIPTGPPPLPFRFVGRMNDEGQQVVYLSRGDQALVARDGETLEGTYKVLGIEPRRIQFEYLPTGEKQELALTATDN